MGAGVRCVLVCMSVLCFSSKLFIDKRFCYEICEQ